MNQEEYPMCSCCKVEEATMETICADCFWEDDYDEKHRSFSAFESRYQRVYKTAILNFQKTKEEAKAMADEVLATMKKVAEANGETVPDCYKVIALPDIDEGQEEEEEDNEEEEESYYSCYDSDREEEGEECEHCGDTRKVKGKCENCRWEYFKFLQEEYRREDEGRH